MAKWFMNAGCPGPCAPQPLAPQVYCQWCEAVNGNDPNAPRYMTLVLSGFGNINCTTCSGYNSAFILENQVDVSGESCKWYLEFPTVCGPVGQFDTLTLQLSYDGINDEIVLDIVLVMRGPLVADSYIWRTLSGEIPFNGAPCMTFDGFQIAGGISPEPYNDFCSQGAIHITSGEDPI